MQPSDVILYIVLSFLPYGEEISQDVEVAIKQPDMETCENLLADLEITEAPEILIFGTHLDIDAYCFSVKALVSEYYEE